MNINDLINENEIFSVFQSIIELKNCKTIGYEVFSRIENHKINELFERAEKEGCLAQLEEKCIKKAIKNAWVLGLKGLLFLNINPELVNDKNFDKDYIKNKLHKYSIHKDHICIEFTFDNIEKEELIKKAVKVFAKDFKIAIKLPLLEQELIDKTINLSPAIIKSIYNSEKENLFTYLTQFCNASKTFLISEKIEHIENLRDNLNAGAHFGQGYFINMPERFFPKCSAKAFSLITKFYLNNSDKKTKKAEDFQKIDSQNSRPISDILTYGETMLEEESALSALKLFQNKIDCPLITVLNEKECVKGVIPRAYFLDLFAGQYGFGLYSRKKVCEIMKTDFLSVDENESVENAVSAATSRDKDQVYSPIIIVHKKIYKGIVTIKDLMESIIAIEVNGRTLEISKKNKLLEQQQKMMKLDLKMAERVQKSFYPSKAPELDKWEIAFEFRPLSSVSGDVYDFYYENKTLNGVSLFDVSGHGVASALVGILAKSLSQSIFNENKDKPLSKIMSLLNKTIIKEKGSVENYMTGVILRIKDNEIEYVNAGHTDILIKNKSTFVFADKENKCRGRFLGIPDLPVDFKSITARVPKDTYFLIYSDCLTESRNLAGDEMGINLLKKVFDSSKSGSAKEVLKDILESFDAFTEAVPIKDDLTVMVLKYKG